MGDIDEPVEALETEQLHDVDDGSASFPDPIIDDEPGEDHSEPASHEEAGGDLPAPPAPPPPAPAYDDAGFTPPTPAQQDYQPAAPPPPPAQPDFQFYTREQLQAGVDNLQISQQQMDGQLDAQNRELAAREAVNRIKQETVQHSITRDLNQYNTLVPGWNQAGTAAYTRANPHYLKLVKERGYPETDSTRLLALEQAFGPIERIKEARNTRTRTAASRDTVQDIGRRGPPPSTRKSKDPLDILSVEDKKHYKWLIEKGAGYDNWNDVRKELRAAAKNEYSPDLRAKHAELLK